MSLFMGVVVVAGICGCIWLFMDLRRERRAFQAHDWLAKEHREALMAASAPRLFKGYRLDPQKPLDKAVSEK